MIVDSGSSIAIFIKTWTSFLFFFFSLSPAVQQRAMMSVKFVRGVHTVKSKHWNTWFLDGHMVSSPSV